MPRIAVPVRPTVCGLPLALSVTVTVPAMVPVTVGARLKVIVHLLPALRREPQVLVSMYTLFTAMLVIVSVVVPVLVLVTFIPALVVLMICCGKVRLVGEKVTAGPEPKSGELTRRHATTQANPTHFMKTPPQAGYYESDQHQLGGGRDERV